MRINRKNIFLIITGVLAMIFAIFILVFRGSDANYYITVDELTGKKASREGPVRVSGGIVVGTFNFDQVNSRVSFKIGSEDGGEAVDVVYQGLPPRSFTPDAKVIVEGVYNNRAIAARKILVRCPENYLPEKAISGSAQVLGVEGLLYR